MPLNVTLNIYEKRKRSSGPKDLTEVLKLDSRKTKINLSTSFKKESIEEVEEIYFCYGPEVSTRSASPEKENKIIFNPFEHELQKYKKANFNPPRYRDENNFNRQIRLGICIYIALFNWSKNCC